MNVEGENVNEEKENTPVNGRELSDLSQIRVVTSNPINRSDMDRLVQGILSVLPRVKPAVYDGDLSVYMEEVIEK